MSKQAVKTIEFEDHGQDFLEWDIAEDGRVLESRPYQSEVWTQYRVVNPCGLQAGSKVKIKHLNLTSPITIKYPVKLAHIEYREVAA